MDFILPVSGELTVGMSSPSGPLLPDLHRGAGVLMWEAEAPGTRVQPAHSHPAVGGCCTCSLGTVQPEAKVASQRS